VWRGTASVGGQSQDVSLDYQGNVTPASASATPPSTASTPPPADSTTLSTPPTEPKP
jgi:hypothetical protein